ncbi:hypothetical protein ACJW30_09G159700 [Castanea mollissima]
MLYPGFGSLESVNTLANRSKKFPTAISMVSPKIWYRPSLYAITCVFPPLTYNTTGSSAPVTILPIAICATQWLTATMGFFHSCERIHTTTAATCSGDPTPGPLV